MSALTTQPPPMTPLLYLISLGNQRIAMITSSNNIPFEKKRLAGYMDALNDHGIPYVPSYKMICNNHYLDSYNCVEALMKLPEKPTAIFLLQRSDRIRRSELRL